MLDDSIKQYLLHHPCSKGREIAYELDVDRRLVNRTLYRMSTDGSVTQNTEDYTWTLSTEQQAYTAPIYTEHPAVKPALQVNKTPTMTSPTPLAETPPVLLPQNITDNAIKIFNFLSEWYKMDLNPLQDINSDSRVRWCKLTNKAIENLPGIKKGDENQDASTWLSVQRLKPILPPETPVELNDWMTVHDSPSSQPTILEYIEVTDEEATEAKIIEYTEAKANLENLIKTLELEDDEDSEKLESAIDDLANLTPPSPVTKKILLEDEDDVKTAVEVYLATWQEWSDSESPRRATIALYNDLFSYRQQLEAGNTSNPQEMVWGVGMTYRSTGQKLHFPLLSIPVEFVSNDSLTIEISSLNRPPICNIHALLEDHPEGAAKFEELITTQLKVNSEAAGLSPFDTDGLNKIMQVDAGIIASESSYADTKPERLDDIKKLTFTLDWALIVQTRSVNYMLQDVERLKRSAEAEGITECALRDIADQRTEGFDEIGVNFRGFSHTETDPDPNKPTQDLYFPKPYNQEQIEVIKQLEVSNGVVLQGPPGTGKTHTIANIISHYLASGKRVLVTSKKSPALKVLKDQLPDGIQMLTGLLLESDRDAQKELEHNIHRVTSEVVNYSERAIRDEIQTHESTIEQLHSELQLNEKKTAHLAQQFQTTPPPHIGCASPRELAEEVVDEAPQYEWFSDTLSPHDGWKENAITSDFFQDLRTARNTAADYLDLDSRQLISASRLPTPEKTGSLHNYLISYRSITEELSGRLEITPKTSLNKNNREKAIELIKDCSELTKAFTAASQSSWTNTVFRCYYAPESLSAQYEGTDSLITGEIEKTFAQYEQNRLTVNQFLLKKVYLADEDCTIKELLEKVTLASEGSKVFGLIEKIKSRTLVRRFESITIKGQPPQSREEWLDVKTWIELQLAGDSLAKNWNHLANTIGAPTADEGVGVVTFANLQSVYKQINTLQQFSKTTMERAIATSNELVEIGLTISTAIEKGLSQPLIFEPISKTISLLIQEFDGRSSSLEKEKMIESLVGSPAYTEFLDFIKNSFGSEEISTELFIQEYKKFISHVELLNGVIAPALQTIASSSRAIQELGAEHLSISVKKTAYDSTKDRDPALPNNIWQAWKWARRQAYLQHIDGKNDLIKLNSERLYQEKKLAKAYEDLAVKKTWQKLKDTFKSSPNLVSSLNKFVTHIKKIGRGKGTLAPFHRAKAQEAMLEADEAVRCWIMPEWRVSESLPPSFGMFDLVIIDEASQSDLKSLPAIARGKKVLIVGDDKQVSPLQVGTRNAQVMELYERFLKGLPFGSVMTIKESIYDLATVAYGASLVRLREHFRCAEPIISFSSKHFYNDEIRCLRVPKASERMLPTLIDVYLEEGTREHLRKINKTEADYIASEIKILTEDPQFGERSIGVISLIGSEQHKFIWDKLQHELSQETIIKHSISCGDPSTFQGSEFDVVFLSMVDHAPKTSFTTETYERRYNVATSRARDRMYLCRSVPIENLKPTCLRHKLVSHFKDPQIKISGSGRDDCESPFEEEVFDFLTDNNYLVSTQVAAAGFRIDMVVEDAEGRRLAIECDGYIAHPEHQWTDDMARQRTLERAGWTFHRIWGPSYYSDKESCHAELLAAIKTMEITTSNSTAKNSTIVESRVIKIQTESDAIDVEILDETESLIPHAKPSDLLALIEHSSQASFEEIMNHDTLLEMKGSDTSPAASRIEVGDYVTIKFEDDDETLKFQIISGPNAADGSSVNEYSPIAALLLSEGSNIQMDTSMKFRDRNFFVTSVVKQPALI